MQILATLLTVVLVLNCLLLGLLVLIQLPKKEAGAGLAFGGGATDALFGAGSGNALTKLTKYAGASFLILSLIIGVINGNNHRANETDVRKALANQRTIPTPPPATPAKPANQFVPVTTPSSAPATDTNSAMRLTTSGANVVTTNITTKAPAAPTNAAAPK
jgi:protein translocase SecG subunit